MIKTILTKTPDSRLSYTDELKNKICFSSNSKHSTEFEDKNHNFRAEIAKLILDKKVIAPNELLKDILLAEAEFSKAIWAATDLLVAIGTLLLIQSKSQYLDDFFWAKSLSFDTECALSCDSVPHDCIIKIINELHVKAKNEPDNKDTEYYIAYFNEYIS